MKTRIPMNSLRAFEAAGRHCHVRRAARELHLTHAAVSRQIRVLEEQLGITLFSREKNRIQLTPAGEHFLKAVQESLDTLQSGVLAINPDAIAGKLVVASTPTISTNWLPEVIRHYSEAYPDVELRCVTVEPYTRQLPRECDLALCLGEPDGGGMEVVRLYREHYAPVCAPALLDRCGAIKKPADIAAYPLLHERYQHWEDWFALHSVGEKRGRTNIFFDYGFQTIEAARRGLGIVLADQLEVMADVRRGTLIRLLDESMPVDAGVYLAKHKAEFRSARANYFLETLGRYLRSLNIEIATL